jgi:SAM-dependent methyltransferase
VEAESIVEWPDGGWGGAVDDLRAGLHVMWSSVAEAWGEHAEYTDARGAPLTAKMLELAAIRPGERVLELACGAGGLGLAAAERVGPGGEVVLSDVAPEMVSIAAQRSAALQNVSARVLDLEGIDQPDGSYDVVLCREGLMLVPEPARAAREIGRVLRPRGRVAVAVWGPRERNPWLGLMLDAVSAKVGAPLPPPGVPGPFSLEDSGRVSALLSDAGLAEVAVAEVSLPMRVGSFDEWWTRTSALAGPLAKVLASLPEEVVQSVRARAREGAAAYETPAGLEFPGVTLLATARAGAAR